MSAFFMLLVSLSTILTRSTIQSFQLPAFSTSASVTPAPLVSKNWRKSEFLIEVQSSTLDCPRRSHATDFSTSLSRVIIEKHLSQYTNVGTVACGTTEILRRLEPIGPSFRPSGRLGHKNAKPWLRNYF